jgi:hypothetical protein
VDASTVGVGLGEGSGIMDFTGTTAILTTTTDAIIKTAKYEM